MWHDVADWLGLTNASGRPYLLWSGFVGDLPEFAVLGAFFGVWRKHNCHVHGCARLGKHPLTGTPYVLCRKHHPAIPDAAPTAEDIADLHSKGTP